MNADPAAVSYSDDERTLAVLRHHRTAMGRRRGQVVRSALRAADATGLTVAFVISLALFGQEQASPLMRLVERLLFVVILVVWLVLASLYGLYRRDEERADHSTVDEIVGVFHLTTVICWIAIGLAYLTGIEAPNIPKIASFWAVAIAGVVLLRAAGRRFTRKHTEYTQNTLIVGAGDVGHKLASILRRHPEYGMNLVGFVDERARRFGDSQETPSVLGSLKDVPHLVDAMDVERVVFAVPSSPASETSALIRDLAARGVLIDVMPRLHEGIGARAHIHRVEGVALIGLPSPRPTLASLLAKRTLDVVLALGALMLAAPLFALIGVLVKLDSHGPIFYRHSRVGRHRRPINVLKFRTMRLECCRGADYGGAEAEREFAELMANPERQREFAANFKLHHDPRVTRLGRFLRSTSLDELPQLFNVLRGDLSLVGPRPVTEGELERYGGSVDAILSVRPGLTGYWQINGRSEVSYEDRVRLDMAYVTGRSLGLDIAILAKTGRALLARTGAR